MKTDNSLWSKRFASCRNRNAALFALLFAMFAVTTYALPVAAAENNWWRTPAQQAQDAFKNNDFERLESIAPNVDWQGIAQHKAGDYEAAQETFNDQLDRAQQSDDFDAVNRALYNRSVNEARSGQFEQARNTLDEVLQSDPEFADAQHNREIVEQLIELQETPPEQNQQGEGRMLPKRTMPRKANRQLSKKRRNKRPPRHWLPKLKPKPKIILIATPVMKSSMRVSAH